MKLSGEKGFRAKQIYEWIHVKMAESFGEMTNLSKTLREKLDREYEIALVRLVERQISSIDGTNKFLFELWDGSMIESVLMRYKHGNSILHLFSGGLPDGLPVLCFYYWRTGEKSHSF